MKNQKNVPCFQCYYQTMRREKNNSVSKKPSGNSSESKTWIFFLLFVTLSVFSTAATGMKECNLRVNNNDALAKENIFKIGQTNSGLK